MAIVYRPRALRIKIYVPCALMVRRYLCLVLKLFRHLHHQLSSTVNTSSSRAISSHRAVITLLPAMADRFPSIEEFSDGKFASVSPHFSLPTFGAGFSSFPSLSAKRRRPFGISLCFQPLPCFRSICFCLSLLLSRHFARTITTHDARKILSQCLPATRTFFSFINF